MRTTVKKDSLEQSNHILSKINGLIKTFSLSEKTLFGIFVVILIVSTFNMLTRINFAYTSEVPQFGGTLTEGFVGTPRFINPTLALSDTDRDLTTLLYSGLMRLSAKDQLIPDLAENYSISEDGVTYTFNLRKDAVFHDDVPVTADDVIFTIKTIQDPAFKSPQLSHWDGVIAEKVDQHTVTFTLAQAYNPFLYNTTVGILPIHLWQDVPAEEFAFHILNNQPIGSGPFELSRIERHRSGIPSQYILKSFDKFTLSKPFIETFELNFYRNYEDALEALQNRSIDSLHGISSRSAYAVENTDEHMIHRISLPRAFGVFLNQSEAPALENTQVRRALSYAINRQSLINNVLSGYGKPLFGPIPQSLVDFTVHTPEIPELSASSTFNNPQLDTALSLLSEAGWERNTNGIIHKADNEEEILSLSLVTNSIPELVQSAEFVAKQWKTLGINVDLQIYEPNDVTQNVIRTRDFQSLLFGQVLDRNLDLYAFWHSSQRHDPGLNISGYANITVDKRLEEIRTLNHTAEREEKIKEIEDEVVTDMPVIFLYSPELIYTTPPHLSYTLPETIITSTDRFADVHNWFLKTERVWNIFNKR